VRRLDRTRVQVPVSWEKSVTRAFPDYALFKLRAAAFELLGIDDPVRRTGFKSYAADVLPRRKKGCDFKSIWRRAKTALARMTHQKCSYCESPIDAERSALVEHFRPKSLFPSLAYDWDNYFLGCGGCNGAKSDKWPAGGGSYVRPDEGDPAALFVFYEDGSVEAAAAGGDAELCLEDFDLKRRWLCEQRAQEIAEALAELRDLLNEPGLPIEICEDMIRNALARRADPKGRYSVAVMQCLRRFCAEHFPGALP